MGDIGNQHHIEGPIISSCDKPTFPHQSLPQALFSSSQLRADQPTQSHRLIIAVASGIFCSRVNSISPIIELSKGINIIKSYVQLVDENIVNPSDYYKPHATRARYANSDASKYENNEIHNPSFLSRCMRISLIRFISIKFVRS